MTTIAPERFAPLTRLGAGGVIAPTPPPAWVDSLGSAPTYPQIVVYDANHAAARTPSADRGLAKKIVAGGYAAYELNHFGFVDEAASHGVPLGRFIQNPFGRDRKSIALPNGPVTSQRFDQQQRCELHGFDWLAQSLIDNTIPLHTILYIGSIPVNALLRQHGYWELMQLGYRFAFDALTSHDGDTAMYDQVKALYDAGWDVLTEANGTADAGGAFDLPAVAFTGLGTNTAGWYKDGRVQPADALAGSIYWWRNHGTDGDWDTVGLPGAIDFLESALPFERRLGVRLDRLTSVQRGTFFDAVAEFLETSGLSVVCSPGSPIYFAGGLPVPVDPGVVISTASATVDSATVAVGAGYVEGEDTLGFDDTAEITGGFDAPTGVLTLTGPATRLQFQDALRSIEYDNAGSPAAGVREVTFGVDDGVETASDSRDVTIEVVDTQPPIVECTPTELAYQVGDGAVAIDDGITVNDADSATLESARVTIGGYVAGEDLLAFDSVADPSSITASFSAGVLTMTGPASLAEWQAALRTVTFEHTGDPPTTDARVIEFELLDSDGNTGSDFRVVDVTAIPEIDQIMPTEATQGVGGLDVTVVGSGFVDGAEVTISGDGVTINSTTFLDAGTLTVNISVASDASLTLRDVTVTNPDEGMATLEDALQIVAPGGGESGGLRSRERNRRIR